MLFQRGDSGSSPAVLMIQSSKTLQDASPDYELWENWNNESSHLGWHCGEQAVECAKDHCVSSLHQQQTGLALKLSFSTQDNLCHIS